MSRRDRPPFRLAEKPPAFELGRFLPYLINRAGARLAVAFSAEIARYGIGLQEWRVLGALQAKGPCRLGDLAALTSIEISTLSRLVGRMTQARLVGRAREDGDRRAVRLQLSPQGRTVVAQIVPLAQDYERLALAGFTPAQANRLRQMLSRVYFNLDELLRRRSQPNA
jgi:DNA-binding MarR family transcriptional regulator